MGKEDGHRVFENRVLRTNVGLRGTRQHENGGDCIMRSLMICPPFYFFFSWRYNPHRVVFYSPLVGFSLLAYYVS